MFGAQLVGRFDLADGSHEVKAQLACRTDLSGREKIDDSPVVATDCDLFAAFEDGSNRLIDVYTAFTG